MTDNVKKFLELASQDEELKKELQANKDPKAILKLAEAKGFKLAPEDFSTKEMDELSEEELKAVSGGSLCACGKEGSGQAHNLDCICTEEGTGNDPEGGRGFCVCAWGFGAGWN